MVPQVKIIENISVDIYEPCSFTKSYERDPCINFSDDVRKFDIIQSTLEIFSFEPNKVKPKLQSTQYLQKFINVLHVYIWSGKHDFKNVKMLLEECALVFNIMCFRNIVFKHWTATKFESFSLTGFYSVL